MVRILTGVLALSLMLVIVGCSSSKPMRFRFEPTDSSKVQIDIDEGSNYRGDGSTVFELKSNDADKKIKLVWGGKTIYAKMDVFNHTELTRISVVPVRLSKDIMAAVEDYKAVTYVVYQRHRDSTIAGRGAAGEDANLRVYDYGDTVTRDALIEQARLNGDVIAVIDFGNAEALVD